MNIYESAEDYLEQILVLLENKGYARSTDIAESLGYTKPSVSVAMKKLRENGYISMEKTGTCGTKWNGACVTIRSGKCCRYRRHEKKDKTQKNGTAEAVLFSSARSAAYIQRKT